MKYLIQMREEFEKAVDAYVNAFTKQFGLDEKDCWWTGDRVGLDNFCFGDCHAISLDDMIYCVENGVTYDEYVAYVDYWIKCDEYNFPRMNLKSWHEGAPRIPDSTFSKLDTMKRDFEDLIEREKRNMKF